MRILLVSNHYKEATQTVALETVKLLQGQGLDVEVDDEWETMQDQRQFEMCIRDR